MFRFISTPNIPESRVVLALMSDLKSELLKELAVMGIKTVVSGRIKDIDGAEAFHADMGFCHIGGNEIFYAPNADAKAKEALQREGFHLMASESAVTAKTPSLNVCITGGSVMCCTRTADSTLLDALKARGAAILHTNQRYTKCSAAVLNENAIITADPSVYELCKKNRIDVLKITAGHILLDGYPYGFIGGCCGLISRDALAFSGNIALHPDHGNIKAFARNHGIYLLPLSGEPLYDIGGILPLAEE